MSDNRLTRLVDKLEKAKAHASNLRKQGEKAAGRIVHSGVTIAGGASVGLMRGLAGDPKDNYRVYIPGTKVQAELAIGLASLAAGLTDMAGSQSDHALSFGNGVLAVLAAEHTLDAVKKYESHK